MRKKNITIILWLLVLAVIAMIFGFSSDAAPASNEKSGVVVTAIEPIVSEISEGITAEPVDADRLEVIVRKCAHVANYFLLSILCCVAFAVTFPRRRKRRVLLSAWGCAAAVAVADEIYQTFVPGRSGQLADVGIDHIGILLGIGIAFLVLKRHIS